MAFPPRAPRGAFNPRFKKEQQQEHRTNHMIRVPEVRLVGENIEPGIYSFADAQKMAQDQQLDLVEISPGATPPVCKIIDYNKFLYDEKKKKKEMKAKSKTSEVKEVRLLLKFADRLKDVGALEGMPKMEGKRMLVMFAPKSQKKPKN